MCFNIHICTHWSLSISTLVGELQTSLKIALQTCLIFQSQRQQKNVTLEHTNQREQNKKCETSVHGFPVKKRDRDEKCRYLIKLSKVQCGFFHGFLLLA